MINDLAAVAERFQITRPLICLDLETTGKVVGVDRVIQIGVMKAVRVPCPTCAGNGSVIDDSVVNGSNELMCPHCEGAEHLIDLTEWSTFVDPQLAIPAEATLKHKITNEMVAGAPTFGDLAQGLAAGLTGVDIVGQNVKFDLRFLEAEFVRVGRPWSYADAFVIDTLRIDQVRDPRDLGTLLKKYCGEEIEDAHDALADVRSTVKVLNGEFRAYPDLPQTLEDLHTLLWPRDPSWVDAAGKIVWRGQEACIGFGKWNGVPLKNVPKDYLAWISGADFADDVKALVRAALQNKFPMRAVQEAA